MSCKGSKKSEHDVYGVFELCSKTLGPVLTDYSSRGQ